MILCLSRAHKIHTDLVRDVSAQRLVPIQSRTLRSEWFTSVWPTAVTGEVLLNIKKK